MLILLVLGDKLKKIRILTVVQDQEVSDLLLTVYNDWPLLLEGIYLDDVRVVF